MPHNKTRVYIHGSDPGLTHARDLYKNMDYEEVFTWSDADLIHMCNIPARNIPMYYCQEDEAYGERIRDTPIHGYMERSDLGAAYALFIKASYMGLSIVGVGNMAHFCHYMSGGDLYCHVSNHKTEHKIDCLLGRSPTCSAPSNHVRAMHFSSGYNATLLAWTTEVESQHKSFLGKTRLVDKNLDVEGIVHEVSKKSFVLCWQPEVECPGYVTCKKELQKAIKRSVEQCAA